MARENTGVVGHPIAIIDMVEQTSTKFKLQATSKSALVIRSTLKNRLLKKHSREGRVSVDWMFCKRRLLKIVLLGFSRKREK